MNEETITYEELMEFFEQQREMEFMYNNVAYAFLSVNDGFVLVRENKSITEVYENYISLAQEASLEGIPFLKLFQNNLIKFTAIL